MVRYDGFIKPSEASRYLGIPIGEIYKMLEAGELPGVRLGNRWRIRISALERWLDEEVSQEELSRLAKRLGDVDPKKLKEFFGKEEK
ncbi:MAG: helix-turn-helix domain-containing protein [Candidatus Bipolaricaulia bacterium]